MDATFLDSVEGFILPFAGFSSQQLFNLTRWYTEAPIKLSEPAFLWFDKLMLALGCEKAKDMNICVWPALDTVYGIELTLMTSHEDSWLLLDFFLLEELNVENYGPVSCKERSILSSN